MKVGDLVKFIGSTSAKPLLGVLICKWAGQDDWWEVLVKDRMIHWPESQLEMVSEGR